MKVQRHILRLSLTNQNGGWVLNLNTIVFPLYVNIKQILILHFVIHLADSYFFWLRKVVEFKIKKIFFFYNLYIFCCWGILLVTKIL